VYGIKSMDKEFNHTHGGEPCLQARILSGSVAVAFDERRQRLDTDLSRGNDQSAPPRGVTSRVGLCYLIVHAARLPQPRSRRPSDRACGQLEKLSDEQYGAEDERP
jgi:hypothetical protein